MTLSKHSYFVQLGVGLSITFIVLFLQFSPISYVIDTIERLDGIIYDTRLSYLPPWPKSTTNIQIVDIDEKSLQEFGRMPWPRKLFAELTNKLTELGAITIAFDVLFTEPEINPTTPVMAAITDEQAIKHVQAVAKQLDGDISFANAMTKNEVVLATLFHQQANIQKGQLSAPNIINKGISSHNKLHEFSGFSANTKVLAEHAIGQGFVNAVADPDGFIRRSPLIVQQNGNIYPSLALAAFQSYTLADSIELHWQQQQNQAFLTAVTIGNATILTDNKGQLLLPFRQSAYYYPYSSAANILADRINDKRFKGAVVFVGTSATGLADLRTTPVSLNFPGVEIHATLFEALMTPEIQPYRPDWWQAAIAIILVIIGLSFSFILPKLTPKATELVALVTLTFVIIANLTLWHQVYIELPLTSIIALIMCLSTYYISHGFLIENTRRKQVKAIFEQYVPPAHIDEILEKPEQINLQGEKKQLTVLFSDVRGFTSISESLTPEQLSTWLNQLFSPMTQDIFDHSGTIDKYVGDMVMAFWGAPLDDKYHATNALKTAFSMLATIKKLNDVSELKQWPKAKIGIGINTGDMIVGDMGSKYRLSYTVLGDAVNLASRLESLTKYYGVDILVGEDTMQKLEDESVQLMAKIPFLIVDKVNVKGKTTPVTMYSPVSLTPSTEQISQCTQFNLMMKHYFDKNFTDAKKIQSQLADIFFNPILLTLIEQRIDQMLDNPPNEESNGAFIHTSK